MSSKSIVVVGSINMDLVAKTPQMPIGGQTLLGTDFFMVPGGKGANQAVAAAKLGADVTLVAKLGKDVFASQSLDNLKSVNINTTHIEQLDDIPSGVALIAVDDNGENSIIVIPGANSQLTPADIENSQQDIANAGVVLAQLEVPLETVEAAARIAHANNVPFVLDPAPAQPLSDGLLKMVDIIKPNETEAQTLTGIEVKDDASAYEAADCLLSKGVKIVIITLGGDGFIIADKNKKEKFESRKVKAIDSTAAGDTFIGSLAYGLVNGSDLADAASFASKAAAFSVGKMGAQTSMPSLDELNSLSF